MVFADDVAHDAGAFLEPRGRVKTEQPHGVQQAAMDRLQPVAGVGQRALGDGRQRIGEIALAERLAQLFGTDVVFVSAMRLPIMIRAGQTIELQSCWRHFPAMRPQHAFQQEMCGQLRPAANSAASGAAFCVPSRNWGSSNSLSLYGSPAARDTARPVRGET